MDISLTQTLFSVFLFLLSQSLIFSRFHTHSSYIVLAFDISRRDHTIKQTKIHTRSRYWSTTEQLLQSLTSVQLNEAASQIEQYQPITNPSVKALLRAVNRVGANALGSDAKRFHMFSELKSSVVYYGLPVIYLTLNPAERYSPLSLLYAGEEIDIQNFLPDQYPLTHRMQSMLQISRLL